MGPSSGLSYAAGLQAQAQGQGQAQQQQQQRRTNDPNEFPALSSPHPSAAQQAFYHHNHQQQQQQETGTTSASPLLHTSNANAGPIAPPQGTHSQYAQHQPPPPPPGFDPSHHLPHDASTATGRLKTEDFPALHGGESGSCSGALAVGAGAGMGQQGMNGARLPPDGGKTIGGSAVGTIHPSLRHQQGVSGSSSPSSSSSAVNGNGNGMANGNGRTTTAVGDAGGASLVPPPGVVGAYSHQQPPQNAQQQQQTQTALQPPSSQQTLQPQQQTQQQPQPQQQQSPGILLLKPVHQLVSSPVDKWGLEALLTLIRTGGRDDQLGLQLGDDLMGIGLDMAAPGPLYPTFTSPWQDPDSARSTLLSSAAEEEYKIPACYNVQTPAASTKIGQFSDETLFYAFYTCPLDVLQMEVAAELYIRNWRWHKELSVWLTRDPNEATEQGPGYERGVFYYFDPNRYEKAETPKDFVCHYDRLEDRPEWLGRQGAEGAAGGGAQTGQAGVQPRGGQAVGPTGTTGTGTAIGGGGIPQSSLQQHPSSHQQQQQQQQQQIAQNS